jgi:hypothetical protein
MSRPLYELADLRRAFLERLKSRALFERAFTEKLKQGLNTGLFPIEQSGTINVADVSNYISARIGWEWGRLLPGRFHDKVIKGQTAGDRFTSEVRQFIQEGVNVCQDIRSTQWSYGAEQIQVRSGVSPDARRAVRNPRIKASRFAQYQHLQVIQDTFKVRPDLEAVFGMDYVVEPDIVVFSQPIDAASFGGRPVEPIATFSPLITGAGGGHDAPLLHASVSCKLTIRSDRAQNARLEALNLIRMRKGRAPSIAFVTAEPLPSRISSLALGTGDLDCIYHVGLYELVEAVEATIRFSVGRLPDDDTAAGPALDALRDPDNEADDDMGGLEAAPTKGGLQTQRARLRSMMDQGRLRDVSDLVLDLLI